jgi:hypothetical protein
VIAISVTIVVLILAGAARVYASELYDPRLTYQAVDRFAADGERLQLDYGYGDCDTPARAKVIEQTDQRVVVAVTAWTEVGACSAILYFGTIPVALTQPLGDRQVFYDTGNGYRLATQVPAPVSAAGIRGVALQDLPCPSRPLPPHTLPGFEPAPWQLGPLHPVTGDVVSIVLCRSHPRTIAMGRSVVVTPDDASADQLITALRLADHPDECVARADLNYIIMVRTTTGDWAAEPPSDACGHPLRPVQRAIAKARH